MRLEGGRFKREGTYVYLWLIHADVWQKPTQYCKAIILQLQINNFFLKSMVSNAENWIRWGKKAIHESDVREHAGETGRIIPVEQWYSHELGGEQMETLNQVLKQLPFLSFPQTASTTLTILAFACQHFHGPGGQIRPSLSPKAKDLPSFSLTQPPDWHDHWSGQTGERRPL